VSTDREDDVSASNCCVVEEEEEGCREEELMPGLNPTRPQRRAKEEGWSWSGEGRWVIVWADVGSGLFTPKYAFACVYSRGSLEVSTV